MNRTYTKPSGQTTGSDCNIVSAPMWSNTDIKNAFSVVNSGPGTTTLMRNQALGGTEPAEMLTITRYARNTVNPNTAIQDRVMYPATTRAGFKLSVRDDVMIRSTWDDGHVTEDPVKVTLNVESTLGNPLTEQDYLNVLMRLLFFITETHSLHVDAASSESQTRLLKLIQGATKPAILE